MKILIGKFAHEANTFASKLADYDSFSKSGSLVCGDKMIDHFRGKPDYLGGMIDVAEELGIELVPTISVLAAAPTLSNDCVDRLLGQLLDTVKQHVHTLDGICLALHGAGCSESTDDLETYVLQKVRAVVGTELPITVTLDLHGNLSSEMISLADGFFGIKHYPHVDQHAAGALAMRTLASMIDSNLKIETSLAPLPMMIPLSAGYTFEKPFTDIQQHFEEYRIAHDLIDITLFHSFPLADTKHTHASVLVVGQKDTQKAAQELAAYIWSKRNSFSLECLSPAEAFDRAEKITEKGYIVINEFSDNPGGGTPGDGTHLLREMILRNHPGSIMGYMYDPEAVAEVYSHSIGDKIRLSLGGKTEPIHGEPLNLEDVEIISMSDGKYTYVSPMREGLADTIGKCARVRVGNVDIVIGSVLHQTFDDRPFLVTGADITQYRYVGLKSAHHFRAYFKDHAAAIIPTDPPGLQSSNFSLYSYKKICRPIFPIDPEAVFE